MASEGPGSSGTQVIDKNYPATSGLTAGTTSQTGTKETLEAEKDLRPSKQKVLL